MMLLALMLVSPAHDVNAARRHLQDGRLPQAILIYREALKRYPADRELQTDLLAARNLVLTDSQLPPQAGFGSWYDTVSLRMIWLTFSALTIVAGMAIYYGATTRPRGASTAVVTTVILSIMMIGFAYQWQRHDHWQQTMTVGVVTAAEPLREGNGLSYPAGPELPIGYEVKILSERGGWLRVELPDGHSGWVRSSQTLH